MYDERYSTGRPMRGKVRENLDGGQALNNDLDESFGAKFRKDPEAASKEIQNQFGKLTALDTKPK